MVIAVTSGEPAGIGPDICLDIPSMQLPFPVVVIGNKDLLVHRSRLLNKNVALHEFNSKDIRNFSVIDIATFDKVIAGHLNIKNAKYVLNVLDKAIDGVKNNIFSAIVTAPIHKGILNNINKFTGHTEYFAQKTNTKQVVMMLVGHSGIRVALVTTHLPLKEIASSINKELIISVVRIIHDSLKKQFGIKNPKISIAGLNPHAGDNGALGMEEIDIIIPAILDLQEQGFNVEGPFAADTIFNKFHQKDTDVILAMYHDQGLPVLKYSSFNLAVNVTLGLPFVRTSVDHGTALELAGTGRANSKSLKEALILAYQLSD